MNDIAHLGFDVDSRPLRVGVRDLDDFGTAGERSGKKIDKMAAVSKKGFGAVAIAASAALGAMASLGAAVQTIRQFDSSMSKLGAVSGATAGQMASMRDIARELGATTEFSATQAADGLSFLAMAGFGATEALAAIPSVLDLATASGMGLAEAADTASNIMSGFGIAAENSADVADILAAAASRANTDVSQLGQAMSTVAPIAAALDISLGDTAAAIGVLSDAGIQGARAGTAMRGVLASLAGPTDQAVAVLKSLGLTIEDVDPATNSLSEVMDKLRAAGLTTAQAMTVFGREAASGALVLVEGSARLREFSGELENVDGAASDMADTMRDNLGGDIDGLMSSVSGLMLALGDAGLTAILRRVVQGVTEVTRSITSVVEGFVSFSTFLNGYILNMTNAGVATDNLTLAMGDEIAQANALFAVMGNGNVMTQSAALAKLSQAETHLRSADAIRQETQAMVDQQVAALELQRITAQDALRSIAAPGTDLEQISARQRAAYEETEQFLAHIISDQASLNALARSGTEEYAAAQAEVVRIREAIANAVDGMVTFEGVTVSAVDLSERLSMVAGGINFSNAISGAQTLSASLGVTLQQAMQVMGLLGGISSSIDVFDPRDPRSGSSDFATERVRRIMESGDLYRPTVPVAGIPTRNTAPIRASGGGGSRSGGGAASSGPSRASREAQREMNELQREADRILRDLMTPQDEFNEAIEQANRLLDAGVLPMEAYASHIDQLTQEFNDTAWKDSGLVDITGQLIDAGVQAASLSDAFDSMKDVAINAIREIAAEMLKNGIFELFFGGASFGSNLIGGDGGSGFFAGIAGPEVPSFAGGGFTGRGTRSGGIDGKGGFPAILHPNETVIDHSPEFIRGPASVVSTKDTARLMNQQQNIHVTVGIDADSSGNLLPFVSSVVGAGISESAKRSKRMQGRP